MAVRVQFYPLRSKMIETQMIVSKISLFDEDFGFKAVRSKDKILRYLQQVLKLKLFDESLTDCSVMASVA